MLVIRSHVSTFEQRNLFVRTQSMVYQRILFLAEVRWSINRMSLGV